MRRTATVATAAALTLTGVGPVAAAVPTYSTERSLASCSDPSTPPSSPTDLVDVDGTLFFTASDGVHGRELWTSDGTTAGTVRITDIADDDDGYFDSLHDLTPVGDTLFFTVDDGVHGRELWSSDGTTAGTVLVRDIVPKRTGGYPSYMTPVGDRLFFTVDDGIHGEELWRSDGTKAGTVLVKDILRGKGSGMGFPRMTAVGSTIYFNAGDRAHGSELWKSDGTKAGTVMVKDVRAGKKGGLGYSEWLATVGDTVYFTADDGLHGRELWKSDGTKAGTALVANINRGVRDANPDYLTGVDGRVFFWADDRDHGSALWTTDGSKAGTVLVRDPVPGNGDGYVGYRGLVGVGGTVFFTSYDDVHGRELWKSDGTEAGTVLVKDINPGLYSSSDLYSDGESQTPTAVGDTLFFTARDGVHGHELWKSDGTEAGTVLVDDIYQDTPDNGPAWLADADGRLFFAADDGVHGYELWTSDGTAAGTALLKDIDTGGRFSVASKATPDTDPGTFLLQAYADKAGRFEMAPVGGSPVKGQVLDPVEGRFNLMLTLTRAGVRELERNGELRVRVRFTFTACDGAVSTTLQRFTLEEAAG